jgi:hypothetical protein
VQALNEKIEKEIEKEIEERETVVFDEYNHLLSNTNILLEIQNPRGGKLRTQSPDQSLTVICPNISDALWLRGSNRATIVFPNTPELVLNNVNPDEPYGSIFLRSQLTTEGIHSSLLGLYDNNWAANNCMLSLVLHAGAVQSECTILDIAYHEHRGITTTAKATRQALKTVLHRINMQYIEQPFLQIMDEFIIHLILLLEKKE